jgi:hypothetical protein
VGKLMQQQVRVVGWFRRGVSQLVDLKTMRTQTGDLVNSWTAFWGKCGGVIVLLIGLGVAAVGAVSAMDTPSSAKAGHASPTTTAAATPTATTAPTATATSIATAAATAKAPAAAPAAAPARPKPATPATPKPAAKHP